MIFERGRCTSHSFNLNDKALTKFLMLIRSKVKDLASLKTVSGIEEKKHLAQHLLLALHKLFIVFRRLQLNAEEVSIILSLFRPILLYAADLFGYDKAQFIELILIQCLCKEINKLGRLISRIKKISYKNAPQNNCNKMFLKMKMEDNCISKTVYNMLNK